MLLFLMYSVILLTLIKAVVRTHIHPSSSYNSFTKVFTAQLKDTLTRLKVFWQGPSSFNPQSLFRALQPANLHSWRTRTNLSQIHQQNIFPLNFDDRSWDFSERSSTLAQIYLYLGGVHHNGWTVRPNKVRCELVTGLKPAIFCFRNWGQTPKPPTPVCVRN